MEYERTNKDTLVKVYNEAKQFLLEIAPTEIRGEELEKYFAAEKTFKTKSDILYSLLVALQSAQMMPNVIGLRRKERAADFDEVLFGYECEKILAAYDGESLFGVFCGRFKVSNAESRNNLWRRFSKSVISAARFVNGFDSASDFDNFVHSFSHNGLTAAALPMHLEKEVYGLGFALACGFLIELGFDGYPKPDVHIKETFSRLGLCGKSDHEVYKTVLEMAAAAGDTACRADKVFWLIGSGSFYLHNTEVGRKKEAFIKRMQTK